MPLAAQSPADRVNQLVKLTERLIQLIETERDLLRERRASDLATLSKEKDQLAAVYAQEMQLVKQDRRLIDGAPRELREKLQQVTGAFRDVMTAHRVQLESMKNATERLVETVSREVTAKRAAPQGYGAHARIETTRAPAAAIAFNQVI